MKAHDKIQKAHTLKNKDQQVQSVYLGNTKELQVNNLDFQLK
jgi:hypothetical protein